MFYQRCALAVLMIAIQLQNAENRKELKLTNLICKSLAKDYINVTLCSMKAISRDVTEVSVHCQLFKKPLNNITLIANIQKYGSSNSQNILGVKIDCCAFHRNKRRNPAAQFIYNLLGFEKYSNMNHSCPYGYHDLIMDKWRLNENHLNMFPFQAGDYVLHTGWFIYNIPVADVDFRFRLFEK